MKSGTNGTVERPEVAPRTVVKLAKTTKVVSVPALDIQRIRVRIRSMEDSPLLMQCFSEKSKTEMLERQMGTAKAGKEKRNPVAEFVNALWWMDPSKKPKNPKPDDDPAALVKGAKFGIPARLFKQAIVDAGDKRLALPKTLLRGTFYVAGKLIGTDRLVELDAAPPIMDERHVRLASGSADLRFRGLFPEWAATLDIEFDSQSITKEQLLSLISGAGWKQGVGDFRPSTCGGDMGRWVLEVD